MKKYFLLLLVCSFSVSFGQYVVPKFGLSSAKISDNSLDEQSSRPISYTGFSLGVAFYTAKEKSVILESEILFIQKGFKIDETPGNGFSLKIVEKLDMRINYLQIPINFRWYPAQSRKFYSITGLYYARALGGRYSYHYENNQNTGNNVSINDKKFEFNEVILGYNNEEYSISNENDFGGQLGLGFKLFKKAEVEISYMLGFSSVSEHMEGKPKNRVLSFTIGAPISLQ